MKPANRLLHALGAVSASQVTKLSATVQIPVARLRYYDENGLVPTGSDLDRLLAYLSISAEELELKLGVVSRSMAHRLAQHAAEVANITGTQQEHSATRRVLNPDFETARGSLYRADCLDLMASMPTDSVDMVFADPPFNLDKTYESKMDDAISDSEYLDWTERWVTAAVRVLSFGGSFFVWNLPKWNVHIAAMLARHLTFRHWIAVDIKYRLPIRGRLYPSHYSLLYFTRGPAPRTFNQLRLPLEVCRHCGGDVRDYGGYKDKLNPNGINLTDVWYDIPPVRHSKFKTRGSNELSLKLLERIISLSTKPDDLVFDPFGGSGTTYVAAEALGRRWIGSEIGPLDSILDRFKDMPEQRDRVLSAKSQRDRLFTDKTLKKRLKNGHWTPGTLLKSKEAGVAEGEDNLQQRLLD